MAAANAGGALNWLRRGVAASAEREDLLCRLLSADFKASSSRSLKKSDVERSCQSAFSAVAGQDHPPTPFRDASLWYCARSGATMLVEVFG